MTKFDDILNSDTKPDYAQIERAIAERYGIDPDSVVPKFESHKLTDAEIEFLAVAEQRRDVLFAKLEEGYRAIEALTAQPKYDLDQLRLYETYWDALLAEYNAVCNEIARSL